eukprot:gene25498-31149_t
MAGSKLKSFKFVYIPCDSAQPVEEWEQEQPEGQEVECLTHRLQEHYRTVASPQSSEDVKTALSQQLKSQLSEGQKISDDMLTAALNMQLVESAALLPGGPHSQFVHVNMYCDDKGQAKQLPTNSRAIGLSAACGVPRHVYGDCFVGRVFEDHDDFYRLNFLLKEVSSDAQWVQEAAKWNQAKATDTHAQEFMQSVGANPHLSAPKAEPAADVPSKDPTEIGKYEWNQAGEEVNIIVACPKGTKAKNVKCNIGKNKIKLEIDTLETPLVLDGQLFQEVEREECNWTIEDSGDKRLLTVNLIKEKEMRWLMLIRS